MMIPVFFFLLSAVDGDAEKENAGREGESSPPVLRSRRSLQTSRENESLVNEI